MDLLWDRGPMEVKDAHKALASRDITLNTIQSTLKRLFEKSLVDRVKRSHAYIYGARTERAQFQREVLGEVVDRLLTGESDVMLHAFVEITERAGEDQLARLERMIALRRAALQRGKG